ncbi:hepatic lectin-like [Neocloeon triangulifer]|uniref:hepatic lectin-like n=1 Tax=Neocloeon triangulifer TaxID=2078957 RepID=UPI00286EEA44|nr:hepatic lectin-like [Neocloeon triangulifer]
MLFSKGNYFILCLLYASSSLSQYLQNVCTSTQYSYNCIKDAVRRSEQQLVEVKDVLNEKELENQKIRQQIITATNDSTKALRDLSRKIEGETSATEAVEKKINDISGLLIGRFQDSKTAIENLSEKVTELTANNAKGADLSQIIQKLEALQLQINNITSNCASNVVTRLRSRRSTIPQYIESRLVTLPSGRYLISEQLVTWYEALGMCELIGMQLATPNTAQKDTDLLNLMGNRGNVWMGATDLGTEGFFYWATNGDPIGPYTNYGRVGPPNNYARNEHCMHYWHNKVWNDFHCDAKQRFICEEVIP